MTIKVSHRDIARSTYKMRLRQGLRQERKGWKKEEGKGLWGEMGGEGKGEGKKGEREWRKWLEGRGYKER